MATIRSSVSRAAAIVCAALCVGSCASPLARIERLAARADLVREQVAAGAFDLAIYRPRLSRTGEELDVYIEGDGSPYRTPYRVAPDPTPRRPLALELMVRDPGPVLYLGRPCYLGLAQSRDCTAAYWTTRRFGEQVLDSLTTALEVQIARSGLRHVTLIGHSGGAALAVLLAQRVESVDRVITVAGNLDVAGWSRLHGYAPLRGSLDPATMRLQRQGLALYHLAGGKDRNVPPGLIESAARRLGGRVIVYPAFDHTCCWPTIWPAVLAHLPPAR